MRQLAAAESRCELAAGRLADLSGRNASLQQDLVHMRALLHEEKAAAQVGGQCCL